MTTWLLPISRVLGRISNVALWLAGIGLVSMTAVVAYQVFMRFVINASPAWTEAGSIMIMTWFIFLGAAVGVRENFHMGFDVLLYVLPPGAKPWLRAISDIAYPRAGAAHKLHLFSCRGFGRADVPVLA